MGHICFNGAWKLIARWKITKKRKIAYFKDLIFLPSQFIIFVLIEFQENLWLKISKLIQKTYKNINKNSVFVELIITNAVRSEAEKKYI